MDILSIGSLLVIVIGILNFVYRFFIRRGPGKRIVIGILNFLHHFIRREHSNDKAGSGEESRIKVLGITIDPRISVGSLLAIVFAIFTFCHTEFVGKVKKDEPPPTSSEASLLPQDPRKEEKGKPLPTAPRVDIIPTEKKMPTQLLTGKSGSGIPETGEGTIVLQPAPQTFPYLLDSPGVIENAGGEGTFTDKYNFAEGECGTSGFISKGPTDVVIFTLENKFTNLNGGTIEVCVTPHRDPKEALHNFSLLRIPSHEKKAGVTLKVVGIVNKAPAIRMRIVINPEIAKSVRSRGVLDWEVKKHYHIAGTWGPEGMYLYMAKMWESTPTLKRALKVFKGNLRLIMTDSMTDLTIHLIIQLNVSLAIFRFPTIRRAQRRSRRVILNSIQIRNFRGASVAESLLRPGSLSYGMRAGLSLAMPKVF